ncbi:MAG: hypothetical protein ACR2NZ_18485, partial [Rubripirellula sp.]
MQNRRANLQQLGMLAMACSFAQSGLHAAEEDPTDTLSPWLDRLNHNAAALSDQSISGMRWQETMDEIYRDTPLASLHRKLDFERLRQTIIDAIPTERGEFFHRINLGGNGRKDREGREPPRSLITKVAYIRKGRSIPPHGHSNMASAFLCISGEFAVR